MSNEEDNKPLDIDEKAVKGEFATRKGEVVIREHSFDGIQEYDQRLPNWWLMVLWASIVLFVVYYAIYYSFDLLPTSTESMDKREKEIYAQREAAVKKMMSTLNDDVLVNLWAEDAEVLAKGKQVYAQHCAPCHGPDYKSNGGLTARSLVDGEWAYGSTPMDVYNIILKGTPADSKGYKDVMRMPPWEQLGPEQVSQVTAFIISINEKDFEKYKK